MDKIINDVAKLIAMGRGDEVADAIKKLQDIPNEQLECEDNEYDDYEDDEEYDDEEMETSHHITETLEMVMQYADGMPDLIPVIPAPTEFGFALIVKTNSFDYTIKSIRDILEKENLGYIPIEIKIVYDEMIGMNTEMLCYDETLEYDVPTLGLVYPLEENTKSILKYGCIIPINTGYFGMGCMAQDLDDMTRAIKTLFASPNISSNPFKFPKVGYKVTKPNGTCKGKPFTYDTMYRVDGELIPHKNGIHYATNTEALKTWYKNDYRENIVYAVQVGKNIINVSDNVKATDSAIILERLSWNNIDIK